MRPFKVGCTVVLLFVLATFLMGSGITSAAYGLIENAGSAVTQRPTMNFVSGCTAADNSGANRTDITCSGGGSGLPIQVNGTPAATATTLNLAASTNMTLTPSVSGGTVTVSFASSGGGGGGVIYHYQYFAIATVASGGPGLVFNGTTSGSNTVNLPSGTSGSTIGALNLGEYSTGGNDGLIITQLPSTWDGSNILVNVDGIFPNGNSGTANFRGFSACVPAGSLYTPVTWSSASTTVGQTAGTTNFVERWALSIPPAAACAVNSFMYIDVNRPSGDTYGSTIFTLGANVGIKY